MKDVSAIKKEMDDVVQAVALALVIVKKHSVLALPDILKEIKQVEAICKDFKPALAEVKGGLDAESDEAILEYALASFQKIMASVAA